MGGLSRPFYFNMTEKVVKKVVKFVRKEALFFLLSFLLLILTVLYPYKISEYPSYIDIKTILTLFALMLITTGFKLSGFFDRFAWSVLKKLRVERQVAFFTVLLSILLSTFLTNDITLFIVIPVALSLQDMMENDMTNLLVLLALGVNAGSLLTPIGNPQNIFLWHNWGISFVGFIVRMFPLFVFMCVGVLLITAFTFYRDDIVLREDKKVSENYNRKLFILSLFLMILFIIALLTENIRYFTPFVFIVYLIFAFEVIKDTDFILILLFILMFVLFSLIANIPIVIRIADHLNMHTRKCTFLWSAIFSQVMSNVPSAIFTSKFSHDFLAIAYGTNVGGTGIIIGSLANLIVLRLSDKEGFISRFHRYSVPFFIISLLVIYILLM